MKFKYIQIQLLSFNKFKLWSKHFLKFEFSSKMYTLEEKNFRTEMNKFYLTVLIFQN